MLPAWPFWVVVTGLFITAIWLSFNHPHSLTWNQNQTFWEHIATNFDTWIRARWVEKTRRQALILRITPQVLLQYIVISAVSVMAIIWFLFHNIFLIVILGALAGYFSPTWIINRRFKQFQGFLRRDFAPLVLILRIYFDLNLPVDQAFLASSQALGKTSQKEIHRLLTAINTGADAQHAMEDWGKRPNIMEYRLLSETIAQNWGSSLTGDALTPLDTLIEANREQGTRSLTDRLDAVSTMVPILSAFGILIMVMFILLYSSFGGGF